MFEINKNHLRFFKIDVTDLDHQYNNDTEK